MVYQLQTLFIISFFEDIGRLD